MPRQLRSAAQTDAWKRLTPVDAAANLICIEKVALRAGAFAIFVVTPTELLSLDNRGTITGTFAFKHMLSVERAMESDITRLFDDGDVQADTIKFTIHMSTQQAAVPDVVPFYSYYHDSQIYFHLRQAWLYFCMQSYVGEPLFNVVNPAVGLRVDQMRGIYSDLEKQFIIKTDDIKSRISVLEEMAVCMASHVQFKSFLMTSTSFVDLLKRILHETCEKDKFSVEELSLCNCIMSVISLAIAGSESLLMERSQFCGRLQIESVFEFTFASPLPSSFPDLAGFVSNGMIDDQNNSRLAAYEKQIHDLAFEFDVRQAILISQLIPLLEHSWLMAIDNPDRDRLFGFEDCVRTFVLKRDDKTFARVRAPKMFCRVIELLRLIETGQPVPESSTAESDEKDMQVSGVEDPVIKANILRMKAEAREKQRAQQLSPQTLKRVCFYLHELVMVVQRLVSFSVIRECVGRENSVDLRHHLSKRADDALLERIHIQDPMFERAASVLVDLVESLLHI